MKIKSIKETKSFKYVEFRELLNDWEHRIYTPSGFKTIKAFSFIKCDETYKLNYKIDNKEFELTCAKEHRVLTNNGMKFVKDLKDNDNLVSYDNQSISFKRSNGPISMLYDIEIDNPHLYYTSGIISHNSIALINTGVANIKRGKNVLHVTLEMSFLKTALRYMGCFTDKWIKNRFTQRKEIEKSLASTKATYGGELVIAEYPPEEISVDTIHALLDMLRKLHGIKIDVVVIDYLELLLSRNPAYNKDDYVRQKRVCTEVDRLGKKEKVFVATATQTNRSGNEGQDRESTIGLNKVAESYGKTMPLHYVVSINQTKQEYEDGRQVVGDDSSPVTKAQLRFFVAKNRNGPTFVNANARVNYETMKMMEYDSLTSMGADGESSKAN